MDAQEVYAIGLGSFFAVFIGWRIAAETARSREYVQAKFHKYVGQTLIMTRPNGSDDISFGWAAAILGFVAANAIASSYRVSTREELVTRIGELSMLNLVPMFFTGRTNIITNTFLSIPTQHRGLLHRWLGRICLIEILIHLLLRLQLGGWEFTILRISLLTTVTTLLLTSVFFIRRAFYEMFLKLHAALAILLLVTMWFHIQKGLNLSTIALALSCVGWAFQACAWSARFLYRNLGGRGTQNAAIQMLTDESGSSEIIRLEVGVRRPWRAEHGQYVFITIPSLPFAYSGRFQSHPYLLAWVNEDERTHLCDSFTLLIETRQGFSNTLRQCRDVFNVQVDGPYGEPAPLRDYDKVVYVATGVGIAAHLISIRRLLQAHNNRTARVRRLALWWFIEKPEHRRWVKDFFESLFAVEDTRRILSIHTVTAGLTEQAFTMVLENEANAHWQHHTGIIPLEVLMNQEWNADAGDMAVCYPTFERQLRSVIRKQQYHIQLFTSPFRMDETKGRPPPANKHILRKSPQMTF